MSNSRMSILNFIRTGKAYSSRKAGCPFLYRETVFVYKGRMSILNFKQSKETVFLYKRRMSILNFKQSNRETISSTQARGPSCISSTGIILPSKCAVRSVRREMCGADVRCECAARNVRCECAVSHLRIPFRILENPRNSNEQFLGNSFSYTKAR